ncbi:MAG: hypothetical protein WC462_05045 [archaeon]
MYVEIDKGIQSDLLQKSISRAGSERKLARITQIPSGMIYFYKNSTYRLPYDRFSAVLNFLGLNENDCLFELIDANEYRSKGGKATYAKYKESGRFPTIHKKMRLASSLKMKEWHKHMKRTKTKEYYELQYARFKKVSPYKIKTKKGHFVRNQLEKEVADLLYERKIDYDYEPYIYVFNKVYFPDFVFGKTVLECTSWKGVQKACSLRKKIVKLEKAGFVVFVVVPEALRSFYKLIEKNIIYQEELVGKDFFNRKVLQNKKIQ